MKSLKWATLMATVSLCAGAPVGVANADEAYSMRKVYTLCKAFDAQ